MIRIRPLALALSLAPALVAAPALASRLLAQSPDSAFTMREAMIPMRDGVRLHTSIYVPRGEHAALPIIFERTPYGIAGAAGNFNSYMKELAADGYIFVFQDIRGRYGSEGTFVMQRAPRTNRGDRKAIDESTDAYDSIDWMLKNIPGNNGRVGMLGISYPGWLTAMAMLDPHPALKAVSPQASPADMFIGDDFHHGGAFRLSYGFEYAAMMETSKENEAFSFDRYDTYDWYLALGPLANVDEKYLHGKLPTWEDFVHHPNYDAFWQRQAMRPYLTHVTVPTLNVAGWWDQEDFYGPVTIYAELEKHDTRKLNYLVVGPWNHGGWAAPEGRMLGNIDFGAPTSLWFRQNVQAPWFAYWLKDKGKLDLPEALVFEGGSNSWQRYDAWPPRRVVSDRKLYMHANGRLSFEPPKASDSVQFDSYLSDPAHPVPYRNRPIQPTYGPGSKWYTWLTEDQRFVDGRPDVLTWETEPLDEDVAIAGQIDGNLFAATSGSDADWVVKLIDVYPEKYEPDAKMGGYELMVANDVLRGRFRDGYEQPKPVTPNATTAYHVDMHTQSYRFRKGHRIMVQVQSTWFPVIDRNPQTFVPNIFMAKASDYRTATQRIYHSPEFPSSVAVEVVEKVVP
jgi:putative CocE/NonD family hydrolase